MCGRPGPKKRLIVVVWTLHTTGRLLLKRERRSNDWQIRRFFEIFQLESTGWPERRPRRSMGTGSIKEARFPVQRYVSSQSRDGTRKLVEGHTLSEQANSESSGSRR